MEVVKSEKANHSDNYFTGSGASFKCLFSGSPYYVRTNYVRSNHKQTCYIGTNYSRTNYVRSNHK
jgi:hypothetical protein